MNKERVQSPVFEVYERTEGDIELPPSCIGGRERERENARESKHDRLYVSSRPRSLPFSSSHLSSSSLSLRLESLVSLSSCICISASSGFLEQFCHRCAFDTSSGS